MNALPEWTEADHAATMHEGWMVTLACYEAGPQHEIQRIDEVEVFPEDAAAVFHVYDKALRGSALHRKALAFVLRDDNVRAR